MVTRYVLPLLFAVLLTGLACTVVFGGMSALSRLDDWFADRAEREGRTDD